MNDSLHPDQAKRKSRPPLTVAEYLNHQINLCGKTQAEIAAKAGFNKANIITMLKKGTTKLPMSKVGSMAHALEVDPLYLFKLVMEEYEPETWRAIQELILRQPVVTANEMRIIEIVRQSGQPDPAPSTDEDVVRLLNAVSRFGTDAD